DPKKNLIIPIYEFYTTSHKSLSVKKYLLSLIDMLALIPSRYVKLPSVIVTDFSWVLISSALFVFNNCTIKDYLHKSFKIIVNNEHKIIRVKHYLCSVHFLKMIIREAK